MMMPGAEKVFRRPCPSTEQPCIFCLSLHWLNLLPRGLALAKTEGQPSMGRESRALQTGGEALFCVGTGHAGPQAPDFGAPGGARAEAGVGSALK